MDILDIEELINVLPESIKLELLKEKLEKIYNLEKKYIEFKDKNKEKHGIYYTETLRQNENDIYIKYKTFLILIKAANLSNEDKISLYKWSKNLRIKMGLNDNLYNVYEKLIPWREEYAELNKKISSKQKI